MVAGSARPRLTAPRRAKIVATLGPATDGIEAALVTAGVDVVRLNFSHGDAAEHRRRADAVRAAAAAAGRTVAILQDLQGPKVRVGRLPGGSLELVEGAEISLTTDGESAASGIVPVPYPPLSTAVRAGDRLYMDDGRIRLRVLGVETGIVRLLVEDGGLLRERKGVNLPGTAFAGPALTEKDAADLAVGIGEVGVDYVALSFVRNVDDLRVARAAIRANGAETPLVAKLEKVEAVQHLGSIVALADALMVARGDLGVEAGPERVPPLQRDIIARANRRGAPVITATQMLESMVGDETPTRAEASDVAHAIWDGTDAVMLSAETAVGRDPVRVVETMDRIIRAAEAASAPRPPTTPARSRLRPYDAVADAAGGLAERLDARAIVALTRTGRTAELLSRRRPRVPIYAISPHAAVCRRLALWWGVLPIELPRAATLEATLELVESELRVRGLTRAGDTLVVVGAHPFRHGVHTNFVKHLRVTR